MLEKLTYDEYFSMWSSHIAKTDDNSHAWLRVEHRLIKPPDESNDLITFYCPTHCFVPAGKTVLIPTGYKVNGKPYSVEFTAEKNACLSPGDILQTIKKQDLI